MLFSRKVILLVSDVCVCVCVCVCVRMYVYVCACKHVCAACVCEYMCVYVYMCGMYSTSIVVLSCLD